LAFSLVIELCEKSDVHQPTDVLLSWAKSDVEQRLGFRGGRYTHVNNLATLLLAGFFTVVFYGALVPIRQTAFATMFFERSWVQYGTVLLTAWSVVILFFKWRKLEMQRRVLSCNIGTTTPDFVLSSVTVDEVIDHIHAAVDDPKQFVVFNRITVALSNLRNLGRVGDVDEILRSQAEQDESRMETSYALVQGFVWAIPVLGFIGTVIGLSQATGSFSGVLNTTEQVDQLATALQGVTAGLSTSFETTLVALVAALGIQMMLTFLKKSEEDFLDNCSEYCTRHIVGRLRIMPFDQVTD
jgi:biopolymer transport protein ExbB/TolQ